MNIPRSFQEIICKLRTRTIVYQLYNGSCGSASFKNFFVEIIDSCVSAFISMIYFITKTSMSVIAATGLENLIFWPVLFDIHYHILNWRFRNDQRMLRFTITAKKLHKEPSCRTLYQNCGAKKSQISDFPAKKDYKMLLNDKLMGVLRRIIKIHTLKSNHNEIRVLRWLCSLKFNFRHCPCFCTVFSTFPADSTTKAVIISLAGFWSTLCLYGIKAYYRCAITCGKHLGCWYMAS